MILEILRVVFLLMLLFDPTAASIGTEHWTYEGDHGVLTWKHNFPHCGGKQQSPISISSKAVILDKSMQAFTFENYDKTTGANWILENNGHTAMVSVDDDFYTISGGGLPGTFKLKQFHFHWGSTDDRGSEHITESKKFPMELHMVHYNGKYSAISEAMQDVEGLAVLSFMFEVTSQNNSAYTPLIKQLSQVKQPMAKVSMEALKLADLIPSDTREYYRYHGSLTTPPCDEIVIWTIFRKTIPISEAQLQEFHSLQSLEKNPDTQANILLSDNFRPVQEINSRIIKANFVSDAMLARYTNSGTSLHLDLVSVLFCAILARVGPLDLFS